MPTFREFLRVAEVTKKDKTSGKRMKEIYEIVKKHDAFKGLTPEKAVLILEDLGPTFVKIGQIASNRADVLPREYCEAFAELRTHVPPDSFEVIIETVERSLKVPWSEVFTFIDEKPLGSASIAQVHRASLLDGTIIAIKVRRPGIVDTMAEDIMLMKHLLTLAEFTTSSHKSTVFSFERLVCELERTTADETDFTVELSNLVRFHHDRKGESGITCPLAFPEHSTDEVLVMEYVTGILAADKDKLIANGANPTNIAQRLATSYVNQIIDDGFFHADPHPGNILIDGSSIIWLDLGMTGMLTTNEQALVGRVFSAVASRDSFELKECLLALAKAKGEVDHGRLLEQMDAMLASYATTDLSDINIGMAFMEAIDILRTQNLSLPASFTMLARGFITIEGVLSELAPEISIVEIVSKHVQKKYFDLEHIVNKSKGLAYTSMRSIESTAKLPTQVSNTLSMLNRGELKVTTDLKPSGDLLASLYAVTGRLALALISAGLFIGSSVLCMTDLHPQIFNVPLLGFLGYIGAFVLGVYVIWETLASRHKQRNHQKPN
ncbi:MAG: AarF/UbiB family protein [Coriobacteriia bacterium]|nr:AarF/UbiB family protein [Coriobacteriia bacterium]